MGRWKDLVEMFARRLRIHRAQGQGFTVRFVPATASLSLTMYAPSVSGSVHLVVTPTTRALTTTTYQPTVTGPVPQLVIPATASLTLATFVPTVSRTTHQTLVPTRATLTTSLYAPTVTAATGQTVTPAKATLTLTRFAPTVTATATQVVTPSTRALIITRRVPTVTVQSGSTGYPPSTTLTNTVPPAVPAIPAYLTPTIYAPWGTTITRVSNVHGQRNQYSRIAGWNSDQTMILLSASDIQPVPCILNANYTKKHDLPFLVGFAQWANTDPNKIYGTWTEENYLRSQTWNGSSWTLNIEHTFTGYSSISLGDGEGGLSDDDETVVLMGRTTAGAQHIIMFDIPTKTILATRTLPLRPDTAFVSRSGDYALVYWSIQPNPDGPGATQGLWQYDRDLNVVRQVTQSARHGDVARLADGTDVWAQVGYGGEFFRLDNGAQDYLFDSISPFPHNTAFTLGHCSGRATGRNGWVYLSVYNYTATGGGSLMYGRDQIVAANMDNPGEVQVFAWSNHRNDGQSGSMYPTNPFAVPSRDGKKVLFGSEWGDTTAPYSPVYAYIAEQL